MNEHETYREMIHENIVNDETVYRHATVQKPKRSAAVRRVLIPILTAAIVSLGLVMAIPSARAEVFGWFVPRSPAEYLATDPAARDTVPELEDLITSPEPTAVENKIEYASTAPYWREIKENFSATLGETMYDGREVYITIDFDGLSGYAIFENELCLDVKTGTPLLTRLAERVAPEKVACFRDDFANLTPYLDGVREQWNGPDNSLVLTLEDGTPFNNSCCDVMEVRRPIDEAFYQSHTDVLYKDAARRTEEEAAAYRSAAWEHVRTNGMRGVAYTYFPADTEENWNRIAAYLDENGNLKLHVRYQASIDHGDDTEMKLDVDLGTVTVNMTAYQSIPSRALKAQQTEVACSGETVFGSFYIDVGGPVRIANFCADTEGVILRVVNPGTVDILGIHDIQISVTMPDAWSTEQKKAFRQSFHFRYETDGESDGYSSYLKREFLDENTALLTLEIQQIPYDRIRTMETVTLTPMQDYWTEVRILGTLPDGSQTVIRTVPIGPNASFSSSDTEHGTEVAYETDTIEYPQWSLTFTVN